MLGRWAAVAAAMILSAGALAQQTGPRPPTPKRADAAAPLPSIGVALLLLGLVMTASLMPSKRGHQD